MLHTYQRLSQETLYISLLPCLNSYSELIRKLQSSILFCYTVIKKPITWDKNSKEKNL